MDHQYLARLADPCNNDVSVNDVTEDVLAKACIWLTKTYKLVLVTTKRTEIRQNNLDAHGNRHVKTFQAS